MEKLIFQNKRRENEGAITIINPAREELIFAPPRFTKTKVKFIAARLINLIPK